MSVTLLFLTDIPGLHDQIVDFSSSEYLSPFESRIPKKLGGAMGGIVLTGLTKNKHHEFKLRYVTIDEIEKCMIDCKCGWVGELLNFRNYGGTKEIARIWEQHSKIDAK